MPEDAILIIGSANMDLVVSTRNFPKPGETVFGSKFGMFPGGKGANQAVCGGKLGGNVNFVGKLGKDLFGTQLLQNMEDSGVNIDQCFSMQGESTGTALIVVDGRGQNQIVVVPGSNMRLTPEDIEKRSQLFGRSKILLMQLEIPLAVVTKAVEMAKARNVTTILNPAPAAPLSPELLQRIDFLTPNETEAEILTGAAVVDYSSAVAAAKQLLGKGVKHVILTLGERGCLWVTEGVEQQFPAFHVQAVDSTAAGDAFNGALAFSLAKGEAIETAIRFASQIAAISVTRMGAQSSMPDMNEFETFTFDS